MFCLLLFGIKIALIYDSMRSRGCFLLFCVLLLGVCTSGWTTVKKPSKFELGINAGLGKWTNQINRDVLIYSLPSIPPDHRVVVTDTDTDVNYHVGFNLKYDFTPKFGLQADFTRINAEYLIVIGLYPRYGNEASKYDTLSLPWKITTIYINGVFHFRKTKRKFFPFAFFGVGFNIIHKNKTSGKYIEIEAKSDVDLGLKIGGGLNYNLPGAPLGFELRAFILYLTAVGTPSYSYQSYTTPSTGFSGENLVWAVDLGLKYRF
jgi:opacity protein-like surface antigen